MPTYGGKWRANSSACDLGHVPRSHSTPLLRLDSTGEISSVGQSSLGHRTQIGCTPTTEVNGNIVNMKNWVTNRVVGCNGLTSTSNLTGSRTTSTSTTDFNANLVNTVRDTIQGSVANTMNQRYPNPKFIQPQCGLSGWSFSGFGGVNAGAFAVFPCHQFSNSFSSPSSAFGHQGKIDMFNNPVMSSARFWTQSQMLEDQHWHQRHRKYDRSYRGHSPKHHKHEHVKHEKKSVLSEEVPSKCKRTQPKGVDNSVSEVCKPSEKCSGLKSGPNAPFSESKDVQFTPVDISDKCSSQVKSNQPVSSSLVANNAVPDGCDNNVSVGTNGAQELNVPEKMTRILQAECKESKKKNGVCDTAKDLNQTLTLNITNTGECQDKKIENSSNENSAAGDSDQCKQESNIHVLLIRKNWKKGRPSASKKRRRKLQKAKSASSCSGIDSATVSATVDMVDGDSSDDASNKTSSSEDDKKSRCSATVSFILGLTQSPTSPDMPNGSSTSSSFVFSFSDDESDEADDCEWDSDFNIEADFPHSNLINFLPNNNDVTTSPLNFKVHFSSLQNGPDTQDKTMEDINTSWNVQISVKEDSCRKKKKPAKKVHFPEEKDLSVVHPMVAWSFAYKAARKGHWENFVRDRDRFRRRIQDAESVLVPVLDSNHRNTVYMKRFEETQN